MKRWISCCTFGFVLGVAGLSLGRPPLIDPPSPPPCAADGSCYPNTCEWGYYPSRWRTWPGSNLEPTPRQAPKEIPGRISPELGPSETPPAELEDAAAPPSTPKHEEQKESATPPGERPAEGENTEPSMPKVPLPNVETSPLGPTSEQDPPPTLPRSLSLGVRTTVPNQASAARPAAPRVSTSDPPPAPPWAQSAAL